MKQRLLQIIYFLGTPITVLSAYWFRGILRKGINPTEDSILMKAGILPIQDHYYQPLINPKKHLRHPLHQARTVDIDWNLDKQLRLLNAFDFKNEILEIPMDKPETLGYYYNNPSFGSGDAEYLYCMIRHFKPKTMLEVGSGNSTLLSTKAIQKNREEQPDYTCHHLCIEPYEEPWLETLNLEVIRKPVETLDIDLFKQLQKDDILFIDSSHIIRAQGDVLHLILTVLPQLNKGVIIHFHDIFTPRDYPEKWLIQDHYLWNEQYILEAFLLYNDHFEIIGATNYLSQNQQDLFQKKCPVFATQSHRQPGSFWIQKVQ